MNIIVEGPDRNGKSTLIETLCRKMPEFNFEVIHFSREKENIDDNTIYLSDKITPFIQIKNFIEEHCINNFTKKNYIFDRFIYSNMAYCPVLQNFPETSKQQEQLEQNYMDMFMANSNSVVIFCMTNEKKNIELLEAEGENYINSEQLVEIRKNYINIIKRITAIPVMKYDFEDIANGDIDYIVDNLYFYDNEFNRLKKEHYDLKENELMLHRIGPMHTHPFGTFFINSTNSSCHFTYDDYMNFLCKHPNYFKTEEIEIIKRV